MKFGGRADLRPLRVFILCSLASSSRLPSLPPSLSHRMSSQLDLVWAIGGSLSGLETPNDAAGACVPAQRGSQPNRCNRSVDSPQDHAASRASLPPVRPAPALVWPTEPVRPNRCHRVSQAICTQTCTARAPGCGAPASCVGSARASHLWTGSGSTRGPHSSSWEIISTRCWHAPVARSPARRRRRSARCPLLCVGAARALDAQPRAGAQRAVRQRARVCDHG
jgi:hypothetical protein